METKCRSCPRACNINRTKSVGACHEMQQIRIAKILEHFKWEEPCLCDERGTLAIFFSGCNLGCDYCQNHEISRGGVGRTFTIEQFCKMIEEKQQTHASIDLITPTHFSEPLSEAFAKIDKKVPVIWNTNGYETVENIQKVSSFVDIFLTDLKYANNEIGEMFSRCDDYFTHALPATIEMCKQKPDIMQGNILKQGVLIRHLVLPGLVKNSLEVLDVIAKHFADRIVSIMSQFTPNGHGKLNRKISAIEYKTVLLHMQKLGLNKGYIQDFDSANDCFVPNFDET